MRRVSCLFLCLLPSQSLIPQTSASAAVGPLELKCSAKGKTKRNLVDAAEVCAKSFPQSAPSLADVKGRAATAGDAVNETRGQTSKGVFDG